MNLDRSKLGALTYADEFDRPDWQSRYLTRFAHGDPDGASSRHMVQLALNEDDYASPNVISAQGETIVLKARPAKASDKADGAKFVTGLLTTQGRAAQLYGYFEIKFTCPPQAGVWPSFWLLEEPVADVRDLPPWGTAGAARTRNWNDVWPMGLNGELDVVEILTQDLMTTYHTATARAHWVDKVGGERVEGQTTHTFPVKHANSATSSRSYGVMWGPDEIIWYRDDVEVARCPNPGLHMPMYMLISMGTGGWNGNKPAADFKQALMTVQSVRAYAYVPEVKAIPAPPAPPAPAPVVPAPPVVVAPAPPAPPAPVAKAKPLVAAYVGNSLAELQAWEAATGINPQMIACHGGRGGIKDWNVDWLAYNMIKPTGLIPKYSFPLIPDTGPGEKAPPIPWAAGISHNADFLAGHTKAAKSLLPFLAPGDGPIYVRLGEESNGNWMSWSASRASNAVFVEAVRAAWSCWAPVSPRFTLVWNINYGQNDPAPGYPGDDITGACSIDAYWKPRELGTDPAKAFDKMRTMPFGLDWLTDFAAKHGKPTAICEWGISDDVLAGVAPLVVDYAVRNGMLWQTYFDINDGTDDFRITNKPKTLAAYKAAVGV